MFLIYGSDKFLIEKQVKKVIDITSEKKSVNILKYSFPETNINEVLQIAATKPLFWEEQIILLEDCTFLTTSKGKELKAKEQDELIKVLKNPLPFTKIIFTFNENIDARKKIVKVLEQNTKVFVVKSLNSSQLLLFVKNYFTKHKTIISDEALELLLEKLPNSLQIIVNELDKMINYHNVLTKHDVDNLVGQYLESNIFDLVNAVVLRNYEEIWHRYYNFQNSNQDVMLLVSLIASQLRTIRDIKIYQQRNENFNSICQKMTINPYRLKILWQFLEKIQLREIHYLLGSLSNLDYNIKRSQINKNIGFELFLLRL